MEVADTGYEAANQLHRKTAEAGATAAQAAADRLPELRSERGERLTVTIARRELRAWLRGSAEGAAVEGAVGRLLGVQANRFQPSSLYSLFGPSHHFRGALSCSFWGW